MPATDPWDRTRKKLLQFVADNKIAGHNSERDRVFTNLLKVQL
jgi:hypothetical protein